MKFCDYNEEERFILNSLLEQDEYSYVEELKFCVKNRVLAPFQTRLVAYGLINKKCILSADTGLGKTGIAAGLINCISQKIDYMKWIFVCPAFNMVQTVNELEDSVYTRKVMYSDNKEISIFDFTTSSINDWDIAVISYEALANQTLQRYLLENREVINGIIIDESQLVCNLHGSTSQLLYSMSKNVEYMFMLTATPIRVNVGQFVKQVDILERGIFGAEIPKVVRYFTKYDEDYKPIGVEHLDELLDLVEGRYISVTRDSLNLKGDYKVNMHLCKPLRDYANVDRKDVPKLVKGDTDGPAMRKLYSEVERLTSEGKKGLVYVNLNDNKDKVRSYLRDRGIAVEILDGNHTNSHKKKEEIKELFVNDKINCVLTNLTVGLNLQCDFIIFYELTFDFKQMLGRGERGLKANNLELSFIIVDGTEDVNIFYENVYNRAKLLGSVCKKDIAEIEFAYREVNRLKKAKKLVDDRAKIEEARRNRELALKERERRTKNRVMR